MPHVTYVWIRVVRAKPQLSFSLTSCHSKICLNWGSVVLDIGRVSVLTRSYCRNDFLHPKAYNRSQVKFWFWVISGRIGSHLGFCSWVGTCTYACSFPPCSSVQHSVFLIRLTYHINFPSTTYALMHCLEDSQRSGPQVEGTLVAPSRGPR